MKIIDNILYLEFPEMVECLMLRGKTLEQTERYLWKAKSTGTKGYGFAKDPEDARKVLFRVDELKPAIRELVDKRYGDPYKYVAKDPIRKLVQKDLEAEKFYLSYKFDADKQLPIEHVNKYVTAASWLNTLIKLNDDKKKYIKKMLNLTLDAFWENVCDIIKIDQVELPTSHQRLRNRMTEYQENGYGCLIDWRFGNKLAAKVNDELSESLLIELLCHPNQYDDVYICMAYNNGIAGKEYRPITPQTVGVWRRKMEHVILAKREGWAKFDDKYRLQVRGKRPSHPLYLVESDDNHLDLLFLDLEDTTQSKYYHKYKAIVVIDSYNDYVLGYAYAENLTKEMVKAAYANAMYHIHSLTGAWYIPHEIKTDNWAKDYLIPFYRSIGHFVKSPTGSKKRGYIEQFFRTDHWKRCIKTGANNYTGHNMTAKTEGVNRELIKSNLKNFPTIQNDEAALQIENFFHRLRTMPQSNGKSKQQEWLEAWANTPENDKRLITDDQFLLKFGVVHQPQGRSITITNKGITPQIGNRQYIYDVPPALRLQNIGKSVNVVYDPYDMSRVLVMDDDKLRFVANSTQLMPKAMKDYHPGDRRYLNALLQEKKNDVNQVTNAAAKREKVLADSGVDAEALLQSGVMIKELKQAAELGYMQQFNDNSREEYDPLEQM